MRDRELERSGERCSAQFQLLNCCVNHSPSWVGERRPEGGVGEGRESAGVRGEGRRVMLCSAPQFIPIWRNSPNVGDRLAQRRGLVK